MKSLPMVEMATMMAQGVDRNVATTSLDISNLKEDAFEPLREIPSKPLQPFAEYKKIGILPYYKDAQGVHFLLASPRPTLKGNEGTIFPYQLARGTPRAIIPSGETQESTKEMVYDLRDPDDVERALEYEHPIESPVKTAIVEAYEELNIHPENVSRWVSCGTVRYKDYGIDLHLVEIENPTIIGAEAKDSYAVAWHTLQDIERKANNIDNRDPLKQFKPGYLDIVRCAAQSISHLPEKAVSQKLAR